MDDVCSALEADAIFVPASWCWRKNPAGAWEQEMKAVLLVVVIGGFLGSPLWTSVLIAMLPRKLLALALGMCAVQGVLAYAIWWFFWGGGIGGEAHLSKSWQFAFAFALLPVTTAAIRFWPRDAIARQDATRNDARRG